MGKPLAIDLFCGLGGWTEGLLAEGYEVIGYDIEAHEYGDEKYPAKLVLQDVLTIHGSQFKDADLIVASPPCQFFSYTAMPWSKAKALAAEVRADPIKLAERLSLFNACFRIQREACEAAGRHIPLIVENVRGAIPWVGRSRWNYGSFHLWGDVPALMPASKGMKNNGGSWFAIGGPGQKVTRQNPDGRCAEAIPEGVKMRDVEGYERNHPAAFGWKIPATSSKGKARKAASARIAKIPLTLSRWIAAHYLPRESLAA